MGRRRTAVCMRAWIALPALAVECPVDFVEHLQRSFQGVFPQNKTYHNFHRCSVEMGQAVVAPLHVQYAALSSMSDAPICLHQCRWLMRRQCQCFAVRKTIVLECPKSAMRNISATQKKSIHQSFGMFSTRYTVDHILSVFGVYNARIFTDLQEQESLLWTLC